MPARVQEGRINRADQSQQQYSQPSSNGKVFDVYHQYIRAIGRMSVNAVWLFSGWPEFKRNLHNVGVVGRLTERRAER